MAKYFKCSTEKEPISYTVGEEIEFTVTACEDKKDITCENLYWRLRGDDGQEFGDYAKITPDSPLKLKYTLKRAGFVHLYCVAKTADNQNVEGFDELNASVGADVKTLTYSDTLPEDFGDYWSEIEELVANTEIKVTYYNEREPQFHEGFKVYDVMIETPDGRPASGCITIPKKEGKFPIRIYFLGYGLHPAWYQYDENLISACFNAHGFPNDKDEAGQKQIYGKELNMYGFNDTENASNKTTYFRNMMIRNLIALKYAKTLPEWNGKDVISSGGSQGALQAISVAAHDKDVTEVRAFKPWFCDLKSVNEGYLGGWRPNFAEGLRYFDTVAQAMHIKCPVTIYCYLGDYVCPPKTVMALYNSIKAPKRIDFVQSGTHSYFPPENPEGKTEYFMEEK